MTGAAFVKEANILEESSILFLCLWTNQKSKILKPKEVSWNEFKEQVG